MNVFGRGASSLVGRRFMVTGASGGLGRQVALELALCGAKVLGFDMKPADDVLRLLEEGGALTEQFLFVQGSVADLKDVERAVAAAKEAWGGLDGLVNNAGICRDKTLLGCKYDVNVDPVLDTNLRGQLYCAKAAFHDWAARNFADPKLVICNISSIIATHGNKGQVVYAITKAGAEGMVRSLATELKGGRIFAVAPGFFETDMTKNLGPEVIEAVSAKCPLGRLGRPEEIAGPIVAMLSDAFSYLNGVVVTIDGGLTERAL